MPGSTFIRIYFHAYVYLFEYFNSRNINITPASMCSCPCCRILVMIRINYKSNIKKLFIQKKNIRLINKTPNLIQNTYKLHNTDLLF